MKKFFSLIAAIFFAASMMADYELVYTLDGSVTDGGNSNYAQDGGGLTQNGIEWSVTGNTTMNPWRIGGKNLEGVDRLAYSKTAISDDIAKIEIEHGTKTLSAVNSMKVEVASDAAFENIVSTFTPTYEPSATVTVVRPDGASWANCYYRITYNVNAGSSNSYLQLVSVKFYKEGEGGVTPPVEQGCNWDEIAFLGNGSGNAAYTDRFKVCAGDPAPTSIVNIQAPGWAAEAGIYVTFPSAAFGAISLEDGQYAIDGAGMVLYASAFLYEAEKEVTIVCQEVTYTLTIKNANPETAPVVPITCAAVYSLEKNAEVALNDVVVTYVNGRNVWVKDESAAMLLYLSADATWSAGDVLSGVAGVVDIYQNIVYEVKPDAAQAAAIVATPGEAPVPSQHAVIEASDVNQYVILPGFSIEGAFTADSKTSLPAALGTDTVTIYNNFKFAYTFEAGKTYDIIGVVSAYKGNPQVYFISAEEATAPVEPLMKTIYCKMDKDWWKAEGAAVGIYAWGDNSAQLAAYPGVRMTPVEGEADLWSYELDINTYKNCIFTRVNGEGDVTDWGAKTTDLTIPTDENDMFTITNADPTWGDPGCTGAWSKYEPAAPVVDEWVEIAFIAPATADEIDADASFTVDGFTVAITDPDNKMSIDANDCRFGTATDYKMYSHRLKSGGKSSATKNFITLTIPEAGTLRIAVRTGSGSATDRNLVIKQGDDTLYNQVIVETMAVKVMEGETEESVYPFVEVPVEAGTVALSYPVGSLNFYAFAFKAAGGETPEPVLPSIALIGEMNSWDGSQGAFVVADDKLSASLTLNLAEMPQANGYAFKLLVDGVAYGSERVEGNPFTFTRENNVLSPVDHIAAGDDEIFWLVMDATGDYTFTYTFADSSLMITYPALAPVEHTYTVAGGSADLFGTTWDSTNAANDMTKLEDGTYKWEKTEQTLPAGNVEFKVCEDHAWDNCWPAQNYQLVIPEAGVYTITITYNPEGNVVAGDVVKTGDAVVDPVVSIAGSMNGWNAAADVMTLAEDKATASLTLTLTAQTYEFKVVLNGGDWRSNAQDFTRENASAADMTGNLDNMHLVADVAGEYLFTWTFATNTLVITYPTAGPEPLVIPTEAPVPTAAEEDVMAIYCNHYATNNANFGISGWAGGYQTLDLNGINVGYWTGMTWECIIDPAHTESAHDYSAYKNLHVDLWAPLPAKIKFTAEEFTAEAVENKYKDGQVVEMQQGWNSMDFVVAEWPGNYDFKNLKCFVFEQYQTLEGVSFEGNPFAFANIYFYGKEAQGIDNTNVEMNAVKFIENGQLIILKNGVKYNVMGVIVR